MELWMIEFGRNGIWSRGRESVNRLAAIKGCNFDWLSHYLVPKKDFATLVS